jgi:hypothetical protein
MEFNPEENIFLEDIDALRLADATVVVTGTGVSVVSARKGDESETVNTDDCDLVVMLGENLDFVVLVGVH